MKNILYLTLFLFTIQGYSQGPENPSAPSATAMNYGKYADIMPNLYNGALSVPISLGNVSEGPLSHNVGLSYHTAGIRANELASEVGLGWVLNAGGVISRSIRGLADLEHPDGYMRKGHLLQDGASNQELEDIVDRNLDNEMDLFHFNAAGLSGKFYIEHTGIVHTIPKSDIRIDIVCAFEYVSTGFCLNSPGNANNSIDGFIVTNTDGTKYHFGRANLNGITEYAIESSKYHTEDAHRSSWHLLKIETHDGLHEITFEYETHIYKYEVNEPCEFFSYADWNSGNQVNVPSPCDMQVREVLVNGQVLSKINTSTADIELSYSNDRTDLLEINAQNKPKRLNKLECKEGSFTKTYTFHQSYFEDDLTSETGYRTRRMKLDEISIAGGSLTEPSYSFDYYREDGQITGDFYFPELTSKAIDHWGYYNGATNNDNLDNIIPYTSIPYDIPAGLGNLVTGSANRLVNEDQMITGRLRSITFPLGGSTTYEYEANSYFSDGAYMVSTTPFKACAFSSCTGTYTRDTVFTITQDMYDSGKLYLTSIPGFSSASFARVTFELNGSTIESKLITTQNGDEETLELNIKTETNLQPNTTYDVNIFSFSGNGLFHIDFTSSGVNELVGGLRVKKITTHDGIDAQKDIIRTYSYTSRDNGSKSSGVLFREPKYAHNITDESWQNPTYHIIRSDAIQSLNSFEGYHIGYNSVLVEYNGNGSQRFDFHTDIAPTTPTTYPFKPELPRSLMGQQRLNEIYTQSNSLIASSENILREGFIQNSTAVNYVVSYYDDIINLLEGLSNQRMKSKLYVINNGLYRPDSVIVTKDGIKTTQSFKYFSNSHLNPTSVTSQDIQGLNVYTTNTEYTSDYPTSMTGERQALIDRNIIIPYKTESFKNDLKLTEEESTFALFSTHPRLAKTETSHFEYNESLDAIVDTETNTLDYKTYNSKGLLTAFTKNGFTIDNTFEYFSNSLLKSSAFGQHKKEFEYESGTRLLSKIIEIDQTETTYTYDDLKRLSTTTECTGAQTTYTYNLTNDLSALSRSNIHTNTTFPVDPTGMSNLTQIQSYQYMDGLGRTIQTVGQATSYDGLDQVNAVEYDNQGRAHISFEPFQSLNINGSFVMEPDTSIRPYSITTYEASPLNRPIENRPAN